MLPISDKPFRVLGLDGGGMRGTYTATYLSCVTNSFTIKRSVAALDLGAGFDLIVGTSTGAIIGCGLAAGVPLSRIVELYEKHGPKIFQRKIPKGFGVIIDIFMRPKALESGTHVLRDALREEFRNETLAQVYQRRKIALAVPAVEHSQHRSWVFKTPHLSMGLFN